MPSKKRSESMNSRLCDSAGGLRKRLQSMGVSVSETTPETSTAAPMTTANSWRSRPTTPPMNRTGMNTAASERVIERMVKAISFDPLSAASIRGMPSSMWRTMFSSTTTASSTTKPTDSVSAISEMMSIV